MIVHLGMTRGPGDSSLMRDEELPPGPQAEATQMDGDISKGSVSLLDLPDHLPLDLGPTAAQYGQRAAIPAGTIDLPANRPMGLRDLDHGSRIGPDQVRMEASLGISVLHHRPPEGLEIAHGDRIT